MPGPTVPDSWFRRYRWDLLWGGLVSCLVLVAFVVPHRHLRWLTPLVPQNPGQYVPLAGTAPILGFWLPHGNWSTLCACAIAVAAVGWGPGIARRLRWRWLVVGSWLTALAWTMSLTLIDGPVRGFAVSLGLGILTSIVTAVTMTRMMIAVWYRVKRPKQLPI